MEAYILIEYATLGLFIATGGLVVVTYCHMRHAKRLADLVERVVLVMTREFENRVSPLVDVQMGNWSMEGRSPNSVLTIPITVVNVGTRPCYIQNAKFICNLRGQHEQRVEEIIRGLASEMRLFHGSRNVYEVKIKGQSWMNDQPRNYVFSFEMEIAGEDRNYQSSRIEFSNFP